MFSFVRCAFLYSWPRFRLASVPLPILSGSSPDAGSLSGCLSFWIFRPARLQQKMPAGLADILRSTLKT